jgi:hypothetical protein
MGAIARALFLYFLAKEKEVPFRKNLMHVVSISLDGHDLISWLCGIG